MQNVNTHDNRWLKAHNKKYIIAVNLRQALQFSKSNQFIVCAVVEVVCSCERFIQSSEHWRAMECRNISAKQMIPSNSTTPATLSGRDGSWILTSAVIIFSMQTGEFNQYRRCRVFKRP